jgi:hypothetical protein
MSITGPTGGPPVFVTKMFGCPSFSFAEDIQFSIESAYATSHTCQWQSEEIFSAALLKFVSDLPQIETLQPSAASKFAVANPIPLLAAATSATFPDIPRSIA